MVPQGCLERRGTSEDGSHERWRGDTTRNQSPAKRDIDRNRRHSSGVQEHRRGNKMKKILVALLLLALSARVALAAPPTYDSRTVHIGSSTTSDSFSTHSVTSSGNRLAIVCVSFAA